MNDKVFKVAVTGPESTGKSELSGQLARHYNTLWVPEYARGYIDSLDRPYNQQDILLIAKGQLESEQAFVKKAEAFLFCDTELIVTKIWSQVKYKYCDEWILEKINENRYDLFLLCDIDLPWKEDPQREHPHEREYLFNLYREELTARAFPYFIVSGFGDERLNNAIRGIETFFAF
jgi:NadR type nicotinamide-nucleotide adenylyltransferase